MAERLAASHYSTCPTCSSVVEVQHSEDGTNSYRPLDHVATTAEAASVCVSADCRHLMYGRCPRCGAEQHGAIDIFDFSHGRRRCWHCEYRVSPVEVVPY